MWRWVVGLQIVWTRVGCVNWWHSWAHIGLSDCVIVSVYVLLVAFGHEHIVRLGLTLFHVKMEGRLGWRVGELHNSSGWGLSVGRCWVSASGLNSCVSMSRRQHWARPRL
jgi:hypothetical protein